MEFYYLFFLATMHPLLLLSPSLALHDNFTELLALLAFKAHVRDPYNILSTNWTVNTSFCTWIGVSCNPQRERVVALEIVNLPLYGTISPQIANLSFVSSLNLTNASLTGSIPESLAQMPRLRSLTLSQNQLSGSIPRAIFNTSVLSELYLENNNLSGNLPSNHSLYQILPQIQVLSVSNNQISGNIPFGIFDCSRLRVLSLAYNQFTGNIPPELGYLRHLTILYLEQNNFTGIIPPSWGNLTNLQELDVSNNMIHGVLPEELGRLSKLERLLISDTYEITGPIPLSLSNITSLRFLILPHNKLTGPIRVQFRNMPRLHTLFLSGNMLTGELDFLGLAHCRFLKYLNVWGNELEGSLATAVGNLSTILDVFLVYENNFVGKIPVELGNLSSLASLALGHNNLVGTIPTEITMLEGLQWLGLEGNRISGFIPQEIGRLRYLNRLYLDGNNLSGPIPDSMGNISSIQHLKLSANALSSGIPQSLWSMTSLIELNLSRNFLTGSVSSAVGKIVSLDAFDMSMNQLSGELPDTLEKLQMLRFLDLSNNCFNGQIPRSFGELINIEVLNLSCNTLSGEIPESLANLLYLRSINLSFNKLEGNVPGKGAFSNLTVSSLVGNAGLCGAPSLGFPPCFANPRSRLYLLKYILPPVAFIVIVYVCLSIFLKSYRKQSNRTSAANNNPNNYRLISYHELVRATGNFSEGNLLGRGGHGSVYRGYLDDGLLAAIKVLNLEVRGASRSFDVECHALSMVRHRNLVKLLSICSNADFRALVLQFMPNGSLEGWLYSHNYYCLSLLQRINIVIDVASALEYLHHHHPQVVVHCDLKPSNILLDEEMTARVSDFGIARLLVGDSWGVTSASTLGTIGYMAPEYAFTGGVSRKGDVYSFGILLLEIFTRKKPTDPMFVGEFNLRRWICEAYPTDLLEIVDSNLWKDGSGIERPNEYTAPTCGCLSSMIKLGIICSRDSPKERLLMTQVVPELHKIKMEYLSST